MLTGIWTSSFFEGKYPQLYYFGLNGISKQVDLGNGAASQRPEGFKKVSEGGYIAHVIAKLGSEGWEMVGTGKGNDQNGLGSNNIFFKRPIE